MPHTHTHTCLGCLIILTQHKQTKKTKKIPKCKNEKKYG